MTFASRLRFIDGLPKVDLHCHLLGTVDAALFARLIASSGVELPASPEVIYGNLATGNAQPEVYGSSTMNPELLVHSSNADLTGAYSLAQVFGWIYQAISTYDDYELIAYDGARRAALSNTLHIEFDMSLGEGNKPEFTDSGIVDAVVRGLVRAEADFGITSGLTIGIHRAGSPEQAVATVQRVIDLAEPRIFGVSLAAYEFGGSPGKFREAYALARSAGLRTTAHASEHVPTAANAIEGIVDVGLDRIDHGYFILGDPAGVASAILRGTYFTCISSTSRITWRPWRRAAIRAMHAAGLKIVLSTDDPGMFPTDLNQEYRIAALELGFTPADLIGIVRNGIEACWLPAEQQTALRDRAEAQLTALVRETGLDFS